MTQTLIITSTLGLKQFATKEEVRKKYMQLVQLYHPDRNPTADQDKFKRMTAAYTVLSNQQSKDRYDTMKRGGNSWNSTGSARADYSSNYSSGNRNSQYQNFYGSHNYQNDYSNAKREYYTNSEQWKRQQQARKSYEHWYQERQKRAQESQQYRSTQQRQYDTYEDFRADFERKFRERESNYKQNFDNNKYYHEDGNFHSMRGNYDPTPRHLDFMGLYSRVFFFLLGFILIKTIIDRIKYASRYEEMMRQGNNGLDGYNHHYRNMEHPRGGLMPPHMGPNSYRFNDGRVTDDRRTFNPMFIKKD